ncbi:3-beta hydroxysteroid dehydrogenase (plasmid) [Burkholderia sp. THE68]|uniref:NAD(P)-dependent oxidoreductase n=1 Tax=Burkholderia sp. THE68 TaxID=758782 RepID=UPI00131750C2|nr:NAD(P)H-binding protein [Burkholderia sp. THE68]BBU32534.1 3-beta hydroxysteroid dehydrogenase [Burkholderia sp. THE68]
MKVALIGGTGFVGKHIQTELLRRGHVVTALARKAPPASTGEQPLFVEGDAYSPDSVAAAVRGHDAVVSAFNPGWKDPDLYDNFMRGSAAIVEGVEASDVRRLIVVGGAGSLFVAPGVQLVDTENFKAHVPPNIVLGAQAARDALNAIRSNTALDWTFVSPPALLAGGERTGTYRVGHENLLMEEDKPAGISVADFAVAVVDEIENPKHKRERFTVAREA